MFYSVVLVIRGNTIYIFLFIASVVPTALQLTPAPSFSNFSMMCWQVLKNYNIP